MHRHTKLLLAFNSAKLTRVQTFRVCVFGGGKHFCRHKFCLLFWCLSSCLELLARLRTSCCCRKYRFLHSFVRSTKENLSESKFNASRKYLINFSSPLFSLWLFVLWNFLLPFPSFPPTLLLEQIFSRRKQKRNPTKRETFCYDFVNYEKRQDNTERKFLFAKIFLKELLSFPKSSLASDGIRVDRLETDTTVTTKTFIDDDQVFVETEFRARKVNIWAALLAECF